MKKIIIISAILASIIVLSRDAILNSALLFLFAGVVPGTNIILPSWFMILFYGLLIAIIVSIYVEKTAQFVRSKKNPKTLKARLPKRRYGTI